jgi:hypothetical protein
MRPLLENFEDWHPLIGTRLNNAVSDAIRFSNVRIIPTLLG